MVERYYDKSTLPGGANRFRSEGFLGDGAPGPEGRPSAALGPPATLSASPAGHRWHRHQNPGGLLLGAGGGAHPGSGFQDRRPPRGLDPGQRR